MNEYELDNMLEEVSARYCEEYDCYMCQIELEGEVFWYNLTTLMSYLKKI